MEKRGGEKNRIGMKIKRREKRKGEKEWKKGCGKKNTDEEKRLEMRDEKRGEE